MQYLVDPIDNSLLQISIFEMEWEHIISWELYSNNNHFPIIQWVPRMLVGELKKDLLQKRYDFFVQYKDILTDSLRQEWKDAIDSCEQLDAFMLHQKKTAESFSFEWNTIYQENDFEKDNYLHFLWWYITWTNIHDKVLLDVWCWSGRFTKMWASLWAKVSIWVDLSEAVDFAFELTKDQENVFIVQWDIYNLPFYQVIDIAQSIGVLHHLPQPKKWFLAIAEKVLSYWWSIIIWVYARKNNARALYLYEPIRTITRHMNKKLLLLLCHIPAFIVHLINYITIWLSWIFWKQIISYIPFYYYINFPYNMKHNDAFDVLATPKSNYYYAEEIQKWYEEASLSNIQGKYLPEAGITFIGNKS